MDDSELELVKGDVKQPADDAADAYVEGVPCISDCLATGALMSGYLHKLSLSRTQNQPKWKRRFFILHPTHGLLLHRTSTPTDRPLSRIHLTATSDTMVSFDDATRTSILEVRTDEADGPRIWRLRAESEEVAMSWLVAVQDVIEGVHDREVTVPAVGNEGLGVLPLRVASKVKRNPVPLGPVLAMLDTRPVTVVSSSSRESNASSPLSPHFASAGDRRPSGPTAEMMMARRPSVPAVTQVYTHTFTPAAPQQPQPYTTSSSHSYQPPQLQQQQQLQQPYTPQYHHTPPQPQYHHAPPTALPTPSTITPLLQPSSTISPMLQQSTSSSAAVYSPTTSAISSSSSTGSGGRQVGAGAGAFSSKRREEEGLSGGAKGTKGKKAVGAMDGLLMG
ncbi:hypothetical protein HDU67_001448, partial [Dinochytrium kinnereticum]